MIRKFWQAFKRGYEDGRRREIEDRNDKAYWQRIHEICKRYGIARKDWPWMAGGKES